MLKEWDLPKEVGGKRKRKIRNNHSHMHHNMLGDVGMCYSLAVMFHVFPVVKRRENRAVTSKDH